MLSTSSSSTSLRALAGPHAAMMLATSGPASSRSSHRTAATSPGPEGPPLRRDPDDEPVSTYFLSANRNKESVTADLKSEEGKACLTRLVARADVLMENFRTGVLDRLGFFERLHEINPRLVVLSITGFGHDGPEGGRAGYDQIAQGEAGLMSLTGLGPADLVGVLIGDLLSGMYGVRRPRRAARAGGHRTRTGRAHVAARRRRRRARLPGHPLTGPARSWASGATTTRRSRRTACPPPPTTPLQVACGNESHWPAFAPACSTSTRTTPVRINGDVAHRDELIPAIEAGLATAPPRPGSPARRARIPAGKVRTIAEVYNWEQTQSQGLVLDVEHPTLGPVQLTGPPPARTTTHFGGPETHLLPPRLGEHDAAIRAWLDSLD